MNARDRILHALCDDDRLCRAGIEIGVDHLLEQPIGALLDVSLVTELVTASLARHPSEHVVEQHVVPAIARLREALRTQGERVGDMVPDSTRGALDALITHRHGPRFGWLRGALDRDTLRKLLAPVLQEMLLSFAARLPLGSRDAGSSSTVAAAAGIAMRLGRGTGERLKNLGKSVADNLGLDLEGRLREAAREYSHGALASLERALLARLDTPEGKQLVEGLSRSVLDHVLQTPLDAILADLDRLPLAEAARLAPPMLEHNLARDLWRGILEIEVSAALAVEAEPTLGEWLDAAELRSTVRTAIIERGEPVLRRLAATPQFADWLDRVLAEPNV